MGFGHRVYRAEDPRARVLRRTAKELGAPRFEVAEALEKAALAELHARRPDRVLATNVEFWSAVVLDFAEVPAHMFTSMFTCARVAGWSAHILEQKKLQRLVRPSATLRRPGPRKPQRGRGLGRDPARRLSRVRRRAPSATPASGVPHAVRTRRRRRCEDQAGVAGRARIRPCVRAADASPAAPPGPPSPLRKDLDTVADAPTIRIPDELKPADGRFGCGPSQGPPGGGRPRSPTSRPATWAPRTGRRRSATRSPGCAAASPSSSPCPTGYEVVLGNGGTTAFWEVATFGLVRDRAQFASFGEFGAKFAKAVKDAPFLGEPTVRKAEPGSAPALVAEAGVDVYATPHNETSTGVAVPVSRVAGADEGALLLVDATSGAGRPGRRRRARPTSTTSPRRSASAPTAASGSR